jgi:hypothetical protein
MTKRINSKVVLLIIEFLMNSFFIHAQTITDTIFIKHPDVAFHKYDSLAEILFVTNLEFDSKTKQWTYVLDIYGKAKNIESYNEEWFARFKLQFKNRYNSFFI